MAFGRNIADLSVGLELNDKAFLAEIQAAEARATGMIKSIDGQRAEAEISADIRQLERKEKKAARLLEDFRKKKAEAKLDADASAAQAEIKKLEAQLARLQGRRYAVRVELNEARKTNRELAQLAAGFAGAKVGADDTSTAIGRMARSLSEMTLRIGPFTGKITTFGKALLLLGPIINGLVGALSSMLSVAGAGLVGAFGLGSAALSGFTLATVGLVTALKPLAADLKTARQASDAYTKAVQKYGADSQQAATAQEKLNSVLGHISPLAREGFRDMGKMSAAWKEMTTPTRVAALDSIGTAFKTLNDLMPQLARRTNETAGILRDSFSGFTRGLRSRSGRGILDDLFGGFNKSLPATLHGLQALGSAWARFAAAFSRGPLQGVAADFDRWASAIHRASQDSSRMDELARKTTAAFKATIKFGGAAGKVLFQFFRAGLGPGMGFVGNLTDGLDKLAKSMSTVEGQAKLRGFFSDSVQTTQLLLAALKPVISLFMQFTEIMLPFSDAALQVAHALGTVTNAITHLGAVSGIIKALFGYELVRMLPLVGRILPSLGSIARMGAGAAIGRGVVAGAAPAAAGTAAAGGAVGGLGGRLMALPGPAKLAGAALIGLGIAAMTLKSRTSELSAELDANRQKAKDATEAYKNYRDQLPQVGGALTDSKDRLKAATEALAGTKKGTAAHSAALKEYRAALIDVHGNQKNFTTGSKEMIDAAKLAAARSKDNVEKIKGEKKAMEERDTFASQSFRYGTSAANTQADAIARGAAARRADAQLAAEQARVQRDLTRALNQQAAAQLNVERARRNMVQIGGKDAQALGALSRQNQPLARKVALKYETPREVGSVAAAASAALRGGVKASVVTKLVADTSSARSAVLAFEALLRGVPASTVAKVAAQTRGTAEVLALQALVAGVPASKVAKVLASTSGKAEVEALRQLIASMRSKTITLETRRIDRIMRVSEGGSGNAAAPGGFRRAAGRGPGGSELAVVGEGSRWQGAREHVLDPARGFAGTVMGPTIMPLSSSAYVIPTEGAFANRARQLVRAAAADLGLGRFAKGKGPAATYGKRKIPARVARLGGLDEQVVRDALDHQQQVVENIKQKKGPGLGAARKKLALYQRDYAAAHAMTLRLSDLETRVDTDAIRMSNADKRNDPAAFAKARTSRKANVGRLLTLLRRALPLARKYSPHKATEIAHAIAQYTGEQLDTEASAPAGYGSLDDYLKAAGLGGRLTDLRLALAQAGLTDDKGDDLSALGGMRDFYQGVLGRTDLSKELRIDATNELSGFLGQIKDLSTAGGAGSDPDTQARVDQLQTQLANAQAAAAINAAYASVAGGPGDIGAGYLSGRQAGGAGPTVIVQTLHPGTPETLRAVADAAAAGFSLQPAQTSGRLMTGL